MSDEQADLKLVLAKLDAVITDMRDHGAEIRAVRATTENVRIEQRRSGQRMTVMEQRLGVVEAKVVGLEDKDASILRTTSSASLEHEAALGGAIAHVAQLDANVANLTKTVHAMATETSSQTTMMEKLTRWQANPLFKTTATWVGIALATYLASRGH